jgi:hypothetical protein
VVSERNRAAARGDLLAVGSACYQLADGAAELARRLS